ncbi:MAG: methyltransferase domain-containing protein [Actinomycetota bacterium]|nr:methyltransferase domain-containing protein [Actinomycetota bacterium]MDP2287074.1 methyltransferase domain-containing protein [Actinomycetota bacterium]
MSAAVWDQWNEQRNPRYPHPNVVQFVQDNFTIPVAPGTWALDLGCGNGADVRFLMECGFNVTAVDCSSIGLAKAQLLVADMPATLEVQQACLSEFEVRAKTYACVISVGALDAAGLEQSRIAVPRLVDSMKPGGKALLVFAGEGDSRIAGAPELNLHGYSRREVESMIVLEYGVSAWVDTCVTTRQSNVRRQIDWLVTIAKR